MAFYDKFPYTNFQELNLDKIIFALKTMQEEMKEFISNNVIKYADPIQWDITKQYEANTIVADPEGNAYISSKPVPVGVALSNTEYWSQIGNFDALFNVIKDAISPYNVPMLGSAATEAQPVNDLLWVGDDLYKTTVAINAGDTIAAGTNVTESNINARIRELVSALTAGLSSVRNDFTAADTEIRNDYAEADTAIRATITANQNSNNARFQAIENQLTSLQDKYYIFIGDSFGAGWTPDGDTTPYWQLFKNHYSIPNDHLYESSIGGAGFTAGTTYLTQLTSLYSSIPDRSKITDIFVMGGRNDLTQAVAGIISAKQNLINYAKVNYPNAKVHIGFIGRSFEYTDQTVMAAQERTYNAYKQDTELFGGIYMDGIECFLNDSAWFASDAKHPNQSGQNSLYNALVSYIETGTCNFNRTIYPLADPSGINTQGAVINNISMYENGSQIDIVIFPIAISTNFTGTFNNQLLEIGTFREMLCPGVAYNAYMTTCPAIIYYNDGSNKYRELPIGVTIINNKLFINLSAINDTGNNYINARLNSIQIKGIHITYSGTRGD